MYHRLESWLNWEPRGLGPYETIRDRLMSKALLLLAGTVTIAALIQLVLPGPRLVAFVPLAFLAAYSLALKLLWRGQQGRAAALVVWSSVLLCGLALIPFGGLAGTIPIFMVAAIMVTVLWLGPAHALLVMLVFVATLLLVLEIPSLAALPSLFEGERLRTAMLISEIIAMVDLAVLTGLTTDALQAVSREAQERALQAERAREAAATASERKASFLAVMSHELRTPLNAILGYAELLREDGGPDTEDLERIERSGQKLLALVDDLLEMARAESTELGPFEEIELRALVEEQIAALDVVARIEAPPQGARVRSHRAYLRRIVSNLLTHAARSTRSGRVEVGVALADQMPPPPACPLVEQGQSAPGPCVCLEVRAQGQPVAPLERASATGLGLALAQRLAQRLGGHIELCEAEEETSVSLYLPLGKA